MVQRVSKDEARRILGVADSTIDRRIQRGELQTEREGRRVWVLLDDELVEASGGAPARAANETTGGVSDTATEASAMLQVKLLQEQLKGQEELIAMYKTQNTNWEHRYYELKEELSAAHRIAENLTRALPAGPAARNEETKQRRSWWPWRRHQEAPETPQKTSMGTAG